MYNNVEDVRNAIVYEYQNGIFQKDKSGCNVVEILSASFVADEESIFGKPNADYISREIEWYESQSLFVQDIPGETPKIWKEVASNLGVINSNYGYLINHEENFCQYENVLGTLGENPESRQAVMIYTRPQMHEDAHIDDMNDFVCTNTVQYFIRDDELITNVQMRSNDIVYGYNNDFAWQKYVRDRLIEDLETDTGKRYKAGPIFWNVGSLHIYERHFNLIDEYINETDSEMEELIKQAKEEAEKLRQD